MIGSSTWHHTPDVYLDNISLNGGNDIYYDHGDYRGSYQDQGQYVNSLELKHPAFVSSPTFAPPKATGFQRHAQGFYSLEATGKERDQQGSQLHNALKEIPLTEVHSTRGLSFHQTLQFAYKDRHEFKGNYQDHNKGINRDAYFLQRRK